MKIAICDDHPVVADGIALLLRSLDATLQIERFGSAAALLTAASGWVDMDLILLDMGLPDSDGITALKRLRELRDDVPIVVVSGISDRRTVLQAIDSGAMGFVPKTASTNDMLEAFKIVLDGGISLPPEDLMGNYPGVAAGAQLELTPRQWQILRSILQGKCIKRIARDLEITEATVKAHTTPILRKLGVTTRTEAIVKVGQMGLRLPT
jgi:DNA-binding NarL/FixJ family response regulator